MRTLKTGKIFLTTMSFVMAMFVILFVRAYEPSSYVYAAVSHTPHELTVKGHVTQGSQPVPGATVRVLENQDGHWNSVSNGKTNKDGVYNINAPEPTGHAIRVVWLKPHSVIPLLVHEFQFNPHSKVIVIGLSIGSIWRFLASQGFSY